MTSPERETSLSWSRVMGLMRKAMLASPRDQADGFGGFADVPDVAEAR